MEKKTGEVEKMLAKSVVERVAERVAERGVERVGEVELERGMDREVEKGEEREVEIEDWGKKRGGGTEGKREETEACYAGRLGNWVTGKGKVGWQLEIVGVELMAAEG